MIDSALNLLARRLYATDLARLARSHRRAWCLHKRADARLVAFCNAWATERSAKLAWSHDAEAGAPSTETQQILAHMLLDARRQVVDRVEPFAAVGWWGNWHENAAAGQLLLSARGVSVFCERDARRKVWTMSFRGWTQQQDISQAHRSCHVPAQVRHWICEAMARAPMFVRSTQTRIGGLSQIEFDREKDYGWLAERIQRWVWRLAGDAHPCALFWAMLQVSPPKWLVVRRIQSVADLLAQTQAAVQSGASGVIRVAVAHVQMEWPAFMWKPHTRMRPGRVRSDGGCRIRRTTAVVAVRASGTPALGGDAPLRGLGLCTGAAAASVAGARRGSADSTNGH
jgi:hypothetical protein